VPAATKSRGIRSRCLFFFSLVSTACWLAGGLCLLGLSLLGCLLLFCPKFPPQSVKSPQKPSSLTITHTFLIPSHPIPSSPSTHHPHSSPIRSLFSPPHLSSSLCRRSLPTPLFLLSVLSLYSSILFTCVFIFSSQDTAFHPASVYLVVRVPASAHFVDPAGLETRNASNPLHLPPTTRPYCTHPFLSLSPPSRLPSYSSGIAARPTTPDICALLRYFAPSGLSTSVTTTHTTSQPYL
jgi:hypothetical protein